MNAVDDSIMCVAVDSTLQRVRISRWLLCHASAVRVPIFLGRHREERVALPHTKLLLPILSSKASPR